MRKLFNIQIEARIVRWTENDRPIWQPSFFLRWEDGSFKYHAPPIFEPTWREAIERAQAWLIEHKTFVI